MGSYKFHTSVLLLVMSLFSLFSVAAGYDWSYSGIHGPTHWHEDFPYCAGQSQSPVPIETKNVFVDRSLSEFKLEGYGSIGNVNMSLSNNGHTVQVGLDGSSVKVRGGGLSDSYVAAQFHFHWGSLNDRGSEHTLNGKQYPMEMHIVHFSSKYRSLKDAMDKSKGLSVLGFFFEIGPENANFEHIISHFHEIAHKDDHVNIESVPLQSLLPSDLSVYYRYHGSLTTPPCYESVIWTVFKETIKISQRQLEEFRNKVKENAISEPDRALADDFRPVQPLNRRMVFVSSIRGRDENFEVTASRAPTLQTSNKVVLETNKNKAPGMYQSFSLLLLSSLFCFHIFS